MKTIPDKVFGYVASALDCEGCITIIEYKIPKSKNPTFSLRVFIGNDCVEMIDYIINWFGGSKESNTRENGKTQYIVRWYASNAQGLLKQLLPYLIVKRTIAKQAIQFQDLVVSNHRKPLTEDEIKQRRFFVNSGHR